MSLIFFSSEYLKWHPNIVFYNALMWPLMKNNQEGGGGEKEEKGEIENTLKSRQDYWMYTGKWVIAALSLFLILHSTLIPYSDIPEF